MQELIDELKLIEAYPMSPLVLKMATDLLEKEKQQIRYAYEQGENDYECREEMRYDKEALSEQYYNQTYNQNK